MANHAYTVPNFSPGRLKFLEGLSLVAMAIFIGFSILLFTHQALARTLTEHGPLYLLVMAGIYLIFMLPTRSLARHRKYAHQRLETSRKGFTFTEKGGDSKTFSWRDVKSSGITLDVRRGVVYVRQVELVVPKLKIKLDNEPPRFSLDEPASLLAEVQERSPATTYTFVWYYPVCPFCRHALEGQTPCGGCGRAIVFRQKVWRPWDILKEDTMLVVLLMILLLLTPQGLLLGGTAIMIFCWLLLLPMVLSRPRSLQVLEPVGST